MKATQVRRGFLAATAAVTGGAVLLRLWLNLAQTRPEHSMLWKVVDTFSYFTMTTNLLAAVVAGAAALRPHSRLARPALFAATSVYILVVAITYQLLLRGDPHGLSLLADTGLHALGPVMFIAGWLAFVPRRHLGWREPLGWLGYPAVYIAWTLGRGVLIHRYPYFFADMDRLGVVRALLNGLVFLAIFWLLGLGAVALGRLPPGRRAIAPS